MKFLDLHAQYERLQPGVGERIQEVLRAGSFIMGEQVRELEEALSQRVGGAECVSCASGTDALLMILMGLGVGRGDAVFLPSFTFVATAEVVSLLGACPVFVDVAEGSFCMGPAELEAKVNSLQEVEEMYGGRLEPKAVIAVDMFGEPAPSRELQTIAQKYNIHYITDAAQSFGSTYNGVPTGMVAPFTAISFFPAKPLGCYGDGGAIFCKDKEFAEVLRSIRVHGKGRHKYENIRIGLNSRLDTLQAAVLLSKLEIFDDELERRNILAKNYNQSLCPYVKVPEIADTSYSAWAQYSLLTNRRDELKQHLIDCDIPVQIYYDPPLHLQPVYLGDLKLPFTEEVSCKVLSLPVHPYLSEEEQSKVIDAVRKFFV